MKILWTEFALTELRSIFDYYKIHAGISVARNIKNDILSSTRHLQKYPQFGCVEELLSGLQYEYRYVVTGNYKIIYRISSKQIYITDIFDCRRNPDKIKENNQ